MMKKAENNLLDRCLEHLRHGEWGDAYVVATEVIEGNASNYDAQYLAAVACCGADGPEAAKPHLQVALKERPDMPYKYTIEGFPPAARQSVHPNIWPHLIAYSLWQVGYARDRVAGA